MIRLIALFVSLVLFATVAFGHAGEVHKYMGTVGAVSSDGSFSLETKEGKPVAVKVAAATVYQFADGKPASRKDLASGMRAVVTISTDGTTASLIKFAPAK
jgi:hypothetical protein